MFQIKIKITVYDGFQVVFNSNQLCHNFVQFKVTIQCRAIHSYNSMSCNSNQLCYNFVQFKSNWQSFKSIQTKLYLPQLNIVWFVLCQVKNQFNFMQFKVNIASHTNPAIVITSVDFFSICGHFSLMITLHHYQFVHLRHKYVYFCAPASRLQSSLMCSPHNTVAYERAGQ